MGPAKPTTCDRDWRDAKSYEELFALDRVAIDLAFARRHADFADLPMPRVQETLLRPHPPIRVLTLSARRKFSGGLRFRRTGRQRSCLLGRGKGPDDTRSRCEQSTGR